MTTAFMNKCHFLSFILAVINVFVVVDVVASLGS